MKESRKMEKVTENIQVDSEAKCKVSLNKVFDRGGRPYYIGKLQFPGTLEFDDGASFMVFTSEDGVEELQIAPVDQTRRSKKVRSGPGTRDGRIIIELAGIRDHSGNTYYVGEAQGPFTMPLKNGIFFTVFLSRDGYEEIQISKLNHFSNKKNNYSFGRDENSFERDDDVDGNETFKDNIPSKDYSMRTHSFASYRT